MKTLIDSSGWIEFFSDGKAADKYAEYVKSAKKDTHIAPSVVVYEVYKRLKIMVGEEKAIEAIAYILEYTKEIPVDNRLCLAAADVSISEKLAMADSMIVATARQNDAKIITSDDDLEGIPEAVFIKK